MNQTSTYSDTTEDDRSNDRQVLLLNASEEIIQVIDWIKAIQMLFSGKATKPFNYEEYHEIKTVNGVFKLPTALVLVKYIHIPHTKCPLSRRNVLQRDNFTCQYCGTKLSRKTYTIDHVVPRCKGGKNTWDNLVTSCRRCNMKKADRSLSESKMTLLHPPRQPARNFVFIVGINTDNNKSWSRWVEL